MAKVKFQLEMGGEKVRTLEQLREHFDIFEGMEYVENGKLVKWLKSRGEDELAETVSALDPQGTDCPKKLCCALGIAFNELKYQQLLQIKRGEEERRKVEEKRKRTIEAEKKRQHEENAQREKIKRGEEERRKAEEEKAKFSRTNVVSASDYPEWAKAQREKERIAAEAEKKREAAKKAQMESVRRGEEDRQKEDRKKAAEERRRNLSKTNVVSASDYPEWAKAQREKERIAAEAEKKREEAKKAQMESVRRGEEERQKEDRKKAAEERRRNLSKTNVVSADDYLEWARMHREQ